MWIPTELSELASSPWIKALSVPAIFSGLGALRMASGQIFDWWDRIQKAKQDAERERRIDAQREQLNEQQKQLFDTLREHTAALEESLGEANEKIDQYLEQHAADRLYVRGVQAYANDLHKMIIDLRTRCTLAEEKLGYPIPEWAPLPPIPQPNLD